MRRAFLYFTFYLVFAFAASAQKNAAGFRMHTGLNIPFYSALDYLTEEGIHSLDLYVEKQKSGIWDTLWRFPATGFGYSFSTLGNEDVFGNAHAIYSFMRVPLTRQDARFRPGIRVAAGAAYMPRHFAVESSPLNRAIGSAVNVYMCLGIELSTRIRDQVEFVIGTQVTHYSNGKTRSPNYGINTGSLSAGINYIFNDRSAASPVRDIPPAKGKFSSSLSFSAGSKVYDNLEGTRYLSSTLSYNIGRHVSRSGSAGIGADLFFDGSIKEPMKENGTFSNNADLFRLGLHGSYSLQYRRIRAALRLGYYIYSEYTVLTDVYTRISLDYLVTERISAGASIRSHFGKADALEFGLGWNW